MSVKPVVVVSKCLEFAVCRYDGESISSAFVRELQPFVQFIPVCPEVELGLSVPREPIWLVNSSDGLHLIQPHAKKDLTEQMQSFADQFLQGLDVVDGFLLKSRSPSCGIDDCKLFDSTAENAQPIGREGGLFAAKVLQLFKTVPVESELSILDDDVRHNFLRRIFTSARDRAVQSG